MEQNQTVWRVFFFELKTFFTRVTKLILYSHSHLNQGVTDNRDEAFYHINFDDPQYSMVSLSKLVLIALDFTGVYPTFPIGTLSEH